MWKKKLVLLSVMMLGLWLTGCGNAGDNAEK